jgi:16S rRNA (cytosine1402-N4)-methyltransferase
LRALGAPADALSLHHANFAGLARLLGSLGIDGADMVLADLGCSSMQLDNPERGFSYKLGGPLDLRLNPKKGRPASALLAAMGEPELEQILAENADEPAAGRLAKGLVSHQRDHPIVTTTDLVNAIRKALASGNAPAHEGILNSALQRVFQALRIAVNDEFGALEMFLRFLPNCLKSGGRAAILTFHSGEDRRVKKAFLEGERDGLYAKIAREVIRPSAEEIRANPRASSAKLRWAVRR